MYGAAAIGGYGQPAYGASTGGYGVAGGKPGGFGAAVSSFGGGGAGGNAAQNTVCTHPFTNYLSVLFIGYNVLVWVGLQVLQLLQSDTSATEGMSRDYLVQQLSGQVSQVDIRYKITNLSVYLTTNLPSGVRWTSLLLGVMSMLRLTKITLKLPHKPYFTSIGAPTVHISCISRLQIIWLRSTLYVQQ